MDNKGLNIKKPLFSFHMFGESFEHEELIRKDCFFHYMNIQQFTNHNGNHDPSSVIGFDIYLRLYPYYVCKSHNLYPFR